MQVQSEGTVIVSIISQQPLQQLSLYFVILDETEQGIHVWGKTGWRYLQDRLHREETHKAISLAEEVCA